MSWSEEDGIVWGDEPQDLLDDVLYKLMGRRYKVANPGELSHTQKMQIAAILLQDKKLKQKIDRVYLENYNRPATSDEYRNLIRVGLLLPTKARKKVKGRK